MIELDISFNEIGRQEDLMQAVNFKALNILNIVGNPLVIEAQTRGVSTSEAAAKRSKSRKAQQRGKAKLVLSSHGNPELG
jgi:hypothetical protein